MIIPINLEHAFHPGASHTVNAYSLRNLLEYMVKENMDYVRTHPRTPSLYRSGVVYSRTVLWEPIPSMYKRGRGDCKSLATALCAEYRLRGIWCRPVFRFYTDAKGDTNYHILVQTENGWEDPSARLGMGFHENARFFGDASKGDSKFLGQHTIVAKLGFFSRLGAAIKRFWLPS